MEENKAMNPGKEEPEWRTIEQNMTCHIFGLVKYVVIKLV